MRYQPMTAEQAAAERSAGLLLPAGEYDFEVMEAEEGTSKAGNDMIKLKLKIYASDGSTRTLFDYLVSNVQWKVRGACEGMGLLIEYDSAELSAHHFEGQCGRVKLRVQKGTEQYPGDRNAVAEYLKPAGAQPAKKPAMAGAPDLDDDIPF